MHTFDLTLDQEGKLREMNLAKVARLGLYVIRFGNEVVRVGESSSGATRIVKGLREPLRRILRGKDRKNYLAYHWREEFRERTIHADFFELEPTPFADNHLRRALEAEVTFQFRLANRAWPRCMSEIHFLERCRANSNLVATAKNILDHYTVAYNSDA